MRIAVVTHGPASSPFWAIVRNGAEAAGRQMDVLVSYRAPDVYSFERMQELIDQAIDSRPDGLVVSIPEPGLSVVIRRATQAGIPVVSINSGSNVSRRLGVLAHLGQPERRAGLLAGRRPRARRGAPGAVRQPGGPNQGLDDRCRGLAQAMQEVGGESTVLGIDDMAASTPKRIANAARAPPGPGGADPELDRRAARARGAPQGRARQAGEAGDVRPRARRARRRAPRGARVRRRPAALPAGLSAGGAALASSRATACSPPGAGSSRPARTSSRRTTPSRRSTSAAGPSADPRAGAATARVYPGLMGGFENLFGDPDELQRRMAEFAESMQRQQGLAWADNAIGLAVQMTVAAINRVNVQGNADEQAQQIRSLMATVFPEAVTLVREARAGLQ